MSLSRSSLYKYARALFFLLYFRIRIVNKLRHAIPNILPTGANSPLGIGRASAYQFAHNGARAIYLCDFSTEYLASQQRELGSLYPDVQIHLRQFDAADEAAMKAVVDEAVAEYGRLDIMFANAGIVGSNRSFLDVSSEEFMETMRVNVLR